MNNGQIILGILLMIWGVSWLFGLSLFHVVIPLLLVWLGIRVITGKNSDAPWEKTEEGSSGIIKRVLIFSGLNKKFISKDFTGAEFLCIFGGGEIDLSSVETKSKKVTLDVTAIFGGLKITVPASWSIKSEGLGILGGFNNQTIPPSVAKVQVDLKGAAIFGGVDILNKT